MAEVASRLVEALEQGAGFGESSGTGSSSKWRPRRALLGHKDRCFDCSIKARCQYWDFAADAWSEEGCIVAETLPDRTICHCMHLSDFGGAMESAMPEMNVVNPFPELDCSCRNHLVQQ